MNKPASVPLSELLIWVAKLMHELEKTGDITEFMAEEILCLPELAGRNVSDLDTEEKQTLLAAMKRTSEYVEAAGESVMQQLHALEKQRGLPLSDPAELDAKAKELKATWA